ncbi:hypothetical protein G6O67_007011 [Ophiocordyceps sinensis]|uniref:Apple domain-containing protein n=1 Tax=Ophiocordyceps sinensis TaxID=72228 RepID=A0A8H4PKB3_9HYPO|nr:hypothetical protein G6O67_007011 [Ophiocordyceps sinensis]
MRSWTLAAVGLLSVAVEAAPRQVPGDELEARDAGLELVGGVVPRSHHGGDAMVVPEGCPTGAVFVSTTTVDVTVYVTATDPAVTEPKPAVTKPKPAVTKPKPKPAVTEPCPDETGPLTRNPYANLTSMRTAVYTPVAEGSSTVTIVSKGQLTVTVTTSPPVSPSATTTEPCDDETATTRPTPTKTVATATALAKHKVMVTTTGLTTTKVMVTTTGLTTHKAVVTAPPAKTPHTTTICVIDTAMTPVTKMTLTAKPPPTVAPTKTVYAHDKATGRPSPAAAYCGVRGEPAGTYFIAEFVEDRPGVPVTEEGCYQFCDSVMEDTDGCRAYRFYPNELGAPRCKLYGMPVSYDVRDIDNHQPGMWYDLVCGPPSARSVSSSQLQKVQRPQVRERVAGDKAGGAGVDAAVAVDARDKVEYRVGDKAEDKAKDKAKDKVEYGVEDKTGEKTKGKVEYGVVDKTQEKEKTKGKVEYGVEDKAGDKSKDKTKDKVEGHRQGVYGSNSTMPGSINHGSTHDTTKPEPYMPLGHDNAMTAQPEKPPGGNGYSSPGGDGYSSPDGKSPKGGLLSLGLSLGPLRR